MKDLEQALRTARILYVAMLTSIPFYVVVGELVGPAEGRDVMRIQRLLILIGLVEVGAVAFLRTRLVGAAAEALRTRPDDKGQLSRWMSGSVASFALCEAAALLGFVLRILGGTLPQAAPFYAGAFVALLLLFPRSPATQ